MKQDGICVVFDVDHPAAFGRLCVETEYVFGFGVSSPQPPSGGCVLKQKYRIS